MASFGVPLSFVTLVLTSTSWHYLEQAQAGSFTLGGELKLVPYFLPSICMKSWTLATTMSNICLLCEAYEISKGWVFVPFIFVLTYQISIHKYFGFGLDEESTIVSMIGNISSNVRPTTKITPTLELRVKSFLTAESRSSAVVYLILSIISTIITCKLENIENIWKSAMCFGFVIFHVTFTQLYLCTNKGQKLLLENISKQTEVRITHEVSLVPSLRKKWKVDKQELTSIEWTFLAICLVSSIVMIFFLQMKLLQGKRDTLISQQFLSM